MADNGVSAFPPDDETRATSREGRAQADRGEFVPEGLPTIVLVRADEVIE
jgi:hypothetical protein